MKKSLFSAPDAVGRGPRSRGSAGLDGAFAAFSLPGLWQENKASLLLAAAVVAAVVVLFVWLARRRRRDTFPEIAPAAPHAASDPGLTQIEATPDAQDSGERRPAPSPGIHGKIEVRIGDQPISSFLVTDNPLPIGRDPAQSLVVIQEPIVSKLHCQIFARGGQVFVKDLNSTNGVYVRDEKVSEIELQDNDVVFLGKKGTVKIIYHR